MTALRRRNDPARLFIRRVIFVALALLVVFLAFGVWDVYRKSRESDALRTAAQIHLDDLTKRQVQLTSDIGTLKTDRGKEEILRQQYDLARSGEKLVVIVDPATSEPIHATSSVMEWLQKAFSWW